MFLILNFITFESIMEGIVIKSTGSWYQVIDSFGHVTLCRIKGKFRIQGIKTTNPIAVGDVVDYELENEGLGGMIVGIKKRKNYIIRKSINLSKQSHIIAANMDQAFLIVTLFNPRTSVGFIDRFLITAEAYQIPVIIVFNKSDILTADQLAEQNNLIGLYENIGYACVAVSATTGNNITVLKELLKDKTTLLSGHSGVGKSTLVNSIEDGLELRTAEISSVHNKGMHTTTFAEMFPLKLGGFIIDTPGIKELGLVDIKKEELSRYFPEMKALMDDCQFNNCLHLNEPKCAVKDALARGAIAISRYDSYLSVLSSEELQSKDYK